ncbi:MAG: 16S rRNA (uracil(1498)-N(3))-methyltransferase [Phycisphaerae bacterium]|nr:16S rRNA (uracil(1498)-N(3))-methyltransferase [Phycisphaerae bacterium]MDW8262027.1 RsmE family RNA methyltransferase [Phycisphaerales bacterium]
MIRRLFCPHLRCGPVELTEPEAHHARHVLRLKPGDAVELFDESGQTGEGVIVSVERRSVQVKLTTIRPAGWIAPIDVFAALPKGERSDWMIEKLSEIGVRTFTPLLTRRGILERLRAGRMERWQRIAIESAKQSRRAGVMRIGKETTLEEALAACESQQAFMLTPGDDPAPLLSVLPVPGRETSLFIGPEGGWTDDESERMRSAGLTPARLTATILRVETAAVVAAALVACQLVVHLSGTRR